MKKTLIKKNKGFVILYSIIVATMVLAVAFGISRIALNEVNFSTSAKDTNDAFYAADIGVECALYSDRSVPTLDSFRQTGGPGVVYCMDTTFPLSGTYPNFSFSIGTLVGAMPGCAKVTVDKNTATNPPTTTIVSKGYNINPGNSSTVCNVSGTQVEREIQATY